MCGTIKGTQVVEPELLKCPNTAEYKKAKLRQVMWGFWGLKKVTEEEIISEYNQSDKN
jgi:hypothetical protein